MDSLPLFVVADRDRLSNLLTSQLLVPCMFIIRETKRKQTEVLHTMYSYLYGWCCCGGVDELTYLSLRVASPGLQVVAELLWNGVVWSSSAWSAAFLQHHDDLMYVVDGGSCVSASAHRQSSCSSTLWSPGITSLILSYHSAATRFWTHRAHRSRVLSPEPNSPLVSTQQSL